MLWQIAPALGWTNPAVLPPLDQIVGALFKGVFGGPLLGDIAISLQRAGIAFGGAVVTGIPLSLLMGQMRGVEVLNSIAGYPSNGINKDVKSICYVLDGSPFKTIKDLEGKTIAVNTLGAHLDYTVREALRMSRFRSRFAASKARRRASSRTAT